MKCYPASIRTVYYQRYYGTHLFNVHFSAQAELPFWRIILFWSGTCLKEITTDELVWLSMAIYAGIRIYASTIDYVPEVAAMVEKTNVSILGGFLSFFLVLFVNQTNGRFLEMYGFCKACSGRIQDVAGLAKTQLPPDVADRLVRHLNAAHIAGYVGLNGIGQGSPYSKAHFFDVYNAKHSLLTPDELEELGYHDMDHGGACMKELCTWSQEDVAEARKAGHIDSYQEKFLHECILAFRAAMDGLCKCFHLLTSLLLYFTAASSIHIISHITRSFISSHIDDYTDQPPHFFYIHFLCFLSLLYLPLFAIDTAYSAGWGEGTDIGLDLLNGLIVFLQCIFVIGLRELGSKMIDPFGDDYEDLSVILYVESTLETCDDILNARRRTKKMQTKLPPTFTVGNSSGSMV